MKKYFSLVKFSHTVFALPFALVGYFLGLMDSGHGVDWRGLGYVLLCMIFARSAAMAFNRYLDRDIDAVNPRTAVREIPAGDISPQSALFFVVLTCFLFVGVTWFINPICFFLSPVALLVVLGYSHTKRFTFLCHFVLGLGLSLAPIGAYLSVTGAFALTPLLYSAIVLFWVSGFDIIYALQDEGFDQSMGLNSIPVRLGRGGALRLSVWVHTLCGILMMLVVYRMGLSPYSFGYLHWIGAACFLGLLIYQHTLVGEDDLSRVNLAFFTTNGIASVIYGSFFLLDYFF